MTWHAAYCCEAGEYQSFFASSSGSAPPESAEAGGMVSCPFNALWSMSSFDVATRDAVGSFSRAAATTAMVAHMRLKFSDVSSLGDRNVYFRVWTGGSSYNYVGFVINADGSITVRAGSTVGSSFDSAGTAFGTSAAGLISDDTDHAIVLRAVVDNTVGEIQLWVDNALIFDLTGIDTYSVGFGTASTDFDLNWYFGTSSTGSNIRVGVVLIGSDQPADAATGVPRFAYSLAPDGVTADNDGTPNGAATNWEAVDEAPSDGGTTDMTMPVGKQGFTFEASPADMQAPDLVWLAGNIGDAAAGSEVVNGFLDDGTTEDASGSIPISATFTAKNLTDYEPLDPSGGAWSKATVDALTGGLERTS